MNNLIHQEINYKTIQRFKDEEGSSPKRPEFKNEYDRPQIIV